MSASEFLEVETTAGTVRGRWRGASASFLGIPFGEAPVGELRFAAPVPHSAWEGVLDALEYGATPQRAGAQEEITLIPEPSFPGDSTLNLNVFTPSTDTALPVLVYIHGGGFISGSPSSPWYDGTAFNRDGVVVVSISYRLGFDGFGWISDAPHNRGVLDWLLALEWVRDNIAAFGGDPARVTISGQSAGGAAVIALLATPRAQPLFAQAYSISGPIADISLTRAEDFGRLLAAELGVEPTRAGLSALPEEQVLAAQARLASVGAAPEDTGTDAAPADPLASLSALVTEGLPFGPVVDGALIPEPILQAIASGIGADKPFLLGATDDEFSMVLAGARDALDGVPAEALLARFGLEADSLAAYLAANEPGRHTADVVGRYVTDTMFRAPTLQIARARGTAPTWVYRFSWASPTFGSAVHCLDMPFIFDCLGAERVAVLAGAEPPQSLADDVHGRVTAFVTASDPGWPVFDETEEATYVYDTPSHLEAHGYASVRPLLPEVVPAR